MFYAENSYAGCLNLFPVILA